MLLSYVFTFSFKYTGPRIIMASLVFQRTSVGRMREPGRMMMDAGLTWVRAAATLGSPTMCTSVHKEV